MSEVVKDGLLLIFALLGMPVTMLVGYSLGDKESQKKDNEIHKLTWKLREFHKLNACNHEKLRSMYYKHSKFLKLYFKTKEYLKYPRIGDRVELEGAIRELEALKDE